MRVIFCLSSLNHRKSRRNFYSKRIRFRVSFNKPEKHSTKLISPLVNVIWKFLVSIYPKKL